MGKCVQKKEVLKIKNLICIFLFLFLVLEVNSHVNSQVSVINSPPNITDVQTYSRYDSQTDNFPTDNFYICIGESNRTVYTSSNIQDRNHYEDVSVEGSAVYKIVNVSNNSEFDISEFGSSYQNLTLESVSGITNLTYFQNHTILNEGEYRVRVNASDSTNSTFDFFNFTINQDNCVRLDSMVNLSANNSHVFGISFSELLLVVAENVTGRIIITEFSTSPVDSDSPNAIDKYVSVDVTGPILNLTVNLNLSIEYTENELTNKGIGESTLGIYKWNGSDWVRNSSTLDTSANKVTFSVTGVKNQLADIQLGVYSLRGNVTSTPGGGSSGGSSSSGGSGGSGGGSGDGGGGTPFFVDIFGGIDSDDVVLNETRSNDESLEASPEDPDSGQTSLLLGSLEKVDNSEEDIDEGDSTSVGLFSRRGGIAGLLLPDRTSNSTFTSTFLGAVGSVTGFENEESNCLLVIIILLIIWVILLILYFRKYLKKKDRMDRRSDIRTSDKMHDLFLDVLGGGIIASIVIMLIIFILSLFGVIGFNKSCHWFVRLLLILITLTAVAYYLETTQGRKLDKIYYS